MDDLLRDPLAGTLRRACKQRNPVLVVGEQVVDLEPERRADLLQPFEVAECLVGTVVGAAELRVAEEVEGDGMANMPRSVARSPLAYASYPRRSRSTFGWSAMRPPLDDSIDVEHSPRPGSGAMVVCPGEDGRLRQRRPGRRWSRTGPDLSLD